MISSQERNRIRDLARKVNEIAARPIQEERRRLWRKHNSLQGERPMILLFPEGAWQELILPDDLQCEDSRARHFEWKMLDRIYYHDHFEDDTVIENLWLVPRVIRDSGWGIEKKTIASSEARGAWHFDPVIKQPSDLSKLTVPEISVDDAATQEALTEAQDLFGDILDVRVCGIKHLSYHLMNQYTGWRGLEEVMVDMYSEPAMLHDAMAFLTDAHKQVLQQYVDLNLLDVNNDNTYHNSGGNSWTEELPLPDCDREHVRPCDMWASAEAQEMAQVSPEHHAEFVLQYEKQLLEPFGLTGYGCCEDLTHKLDDVFSIPHIRRISISPWADVEQCAARLGSAYIFSWKPHPSHLVGAFDEDSVRAYIRHTVEAARAHGCMLEMVLKDTHTCESHPERFERWTAIAREEIERT